MFLVPAFKVDTLVALACKEKGKGWTKGFSVRRDRQPQTARSGRLFLFAATRFGRRGEEGDYG